jgi:hypothetical protein
MKRAEQPVPHRKAASEVLVEVGRVGGMVHLMVRRAEKDTAGQPAKRNPQMRMLEMDIDMDEDDQDQVRVGQHIMIDRGPNRIVRNTVGCANDHRHHVGEQPRIDRMDAEGRDWRQHIRRVMHLVEFPQKRHPVTQIVMQPIAKLICEKQHHGERRDAWQIREARSQPARRTRGQYTNGAVADRAKGK